MEEQLKLKSLKTLQQHQATYQEQILKSHKKVKDTTQEQYEAGVTIGLASI
jgi:hypothetical protein